VVTGLLGRKATDRGEHAESIAGQHNDIGRLTVDNAGDEGIRDVFDGICTTSVLGDTDVIVVGSAR